MPEGKRMQYRCWLFCVPFASPPVIILLCTSLVLVLNPVIFDLHMYQRQVHGSSVQLDEVLFHKHVWLKKEYSAIRFLCSLRHYWDSVPSTMGKSGQLHLIVLIQTVFVLYPGFWFESNLNQTLISASVIFLSLYIFCFLGFCTHNLTSLHLFTHMSVHCFLCPSNVTDLTEIVCIVL